MAGENGYVVVSRSVRLTGIFCLVLVLTVINVFAFAAVLPVLFGEWGLSKTDAGWIAGIYFAAHAVAVPVLTALTDRVDARRVCLVGTGLTFAGAAGFALFAEGFWTALTFQAIAGVGLAGTYMPGVRGLVDRYEGGHQSRAVAFYTSSFSLGTAMSFLVVGLVEGALGWRWAFGAAALAAFAAINLVAWAVPAKAPVRVEQGTRLLDFRPVLRNRRAMGYVLGYGVHAWELLTVRSWIVAFLAFCLTLHEEANVALAPTTVATLGALISTAASLFGAELATRFGRVRVVAIVMVVSAAIAIAIGFTAAWSYGAAAALALIYCALVQADSAALTTGSVEAAEAGRRGATLAVHSLVGYIGGAMGPVVVGVVLDITGGGTTVVSWGLAFASIGLVGLLGPVAVATLSGRHSPALRQQS